jgi:transcriptional regulator NrdR family protein
MRGRVVYGYWWGMSKEEKNPGSSISESPICAKCAHRYDSIDRVDKILILVIKKYRRLVSAIDEVVKHSQDHNPHKPP